MNLAEITVLIIVKSNNDRFPGKNLGIIKVNESTKFTLLELKIVQLLEIFKNTQILVSSNSVEYLDIASGYGLKTHKRDEYYCKTDTPLSEVLVNVCSEIETKYTLRACVNYPLIGPKVMKDFLDYIGENEPKLDSGVVCSEVVDGHFWYDEDWLNFRPGKMHKNSQDVKNPRRVVWGLSAKSTVKILNDMNLFNDLNNSFEVPFKNAVDINKPEDLELAQMLFIHEFNSNNQVKLF
jgi:CMP-N-acetylneuraminic acid synthetase